MAQAAPTSTKACPRCGGTLSRVPVPSRTDFSTPICAACGTSEKLEIVRSGKVSPQRRWPVTPLR